MKVKRRTALLVLISIFVPAFVTLVYAMLVAAGALGGRFVC